MHGFLYIKTILSFYPLQLGLYEERSLKKSSIFNNGHTRFTFNSNMLPFLPIRFDMIYKDEQHNLQENQLAI